MSTSTPPVGAIVIVTYNCREFVGRCLRSLEPVAGGWEIVVVDNCSVDGTAGSVRAEFPRVRLIEAGANIGFAAANNRGAENSTAPWLFFLNPDTTVLPDTLAVLMETAVKRDATVLAPRLNWPDGRYQVDSAERRLPTLVQFVSDFLLLHRLGARRPVTDGFSPERPGALEQPIAAALLIRRDIFDAVGRFDERFHPIWYEDVDLCKRLLERGSVIWYEPRAVVLHERQHSLPLFSSTAVLAMVNANAVRYVRKHFSPAAGAAMRAAAVAGTLLRACLRAFLPRDDGALRGHLQLAWRIARYSDEARWYR